MFKRILICTDFSDGLHRLVNFVSSLAAGGIEQIVFLHTIPLSGEREIPRPDEEETQQVRDRFAPALKQIPEGVDVKVEVQWGRPIDHIIGVTKTYQIDLILLGMPSRSLLTEKLFGSTTMELCQKVMTPIMILRPQLISTYTVEELDLRCQHLFRYLLLPYDGSAAADYLIERVKVHAEKRPKHSLEQCLLYWVVEDSGRRAIPKDYEIQQAGEKIAQVKANLQTLDLEVESSVRQGNAIVEVLTAARDYDISAIAVSSDSLGKLLEWSVPSFTGELLRRSWHPVVYFPPKRK